MVIAAAAAVRVAGAPMFNVLVDSAYLPFCLVVQTSYISSVVTCGHVDDFIGDLLVICRRDNPSAGPLNMGWQHFRNKCRAGHFGKTTCGPKCLLRRPKDKPTKHVRHECNLGVASKTSRHAPPGICDRTWARLSGEASRARRVC